MSRSRCKSMRPLFLLLYIIHRLLHGPRKWSRLPSVSEIRSNANDVANDLNLCQLSSLDTNRTLKVRFHVVSFSNCTSF
jgi:hypothetical protein